MHHVIIGSGVAGITAALELSRRQAGPVDVYTDEPHPYYYRPQLSHFMAGEISLNELLKRSPEWYAQRGIQLHLNTPVSRLDPDRKQILLAGGTPVAYDCLLVAAGSLPIVPRMEGATQAGVFTWRTLSDALAIKERAARCRQAVVIGGGLLGLEAAHGLHKAGLDVTVLEFFPRLLPRQLDQEGATLLQQLTEGLGLRVAVGAETQALLGDGEVTGVRLKDGREFPAQLVVVATGVRCNVALAAGTALATDRGLIVDEHMATNLPDIYAAGDIASFQGRTWAIAPVAQAQGRVAAANMAGDPQVYEAAPPATTLKIVGLDLTSVGTTQPEPGAEGYVETRETDIAAGRYKKLVLKEGRLVGAIVIGDKALAKKLEGMVAEKTPLTVEEVQCLL